MNSVELIGRLTRDPETRYTSGSQQAVTMFTLAIDRPMAKEGQQQADFPRIVVYGKQAESCEKYLKKGRMVAVQGKITTGSYQNKRGETVYTTDITASRVEFLNYENNLGNGYHAAQKEEPSQMGFEAIDEAVPF